MKYLMPLRLFHEVLKSNKIKKDRLLGLDVGNKYVGIAISDVNNNIASPFRMLHKARFGNLMADELQNIISEFSVEGVIVGHHFHKNANSEEVSQVKDFIDDLNKSKKLTDLKYTCWDECFTSKNVALILKHSKLDPVEREIAMHKFSASVILQGYLDFYNVG